MIKNTWIVILLIMPLMWSCSEFFTSAPAENELLDGPMEGLSQAQLTTFIKGDDAFGEVFVPGTGLGPYFVTASCAQCHPGDGKGHPTNTLTRFGKMNGGVFDHMIEEGGPQLQNRSIPGFIPETIPSSATGISRFTAPAVTGLGLLAAVSDQTILDMADPDDLDSDGISGVPNYQVPPAYFTPLDIHIPDSEGRYIGRFGKKAGAINLLIQTVGAYKQDMGVTTEFDTEDPINHLESDAQLADVPDPEVSTEKVNHLVFYLSTLKSPIRRNEDDPQVLTGEQIFKDIGCEACHKQTLLSAFNSISVLSEKEFHPYTDLLMHDMGSGLDDGYTEGTALTSEWRTPPLWGIGLSKDVQGGTYFLLHDGRAKSLEEAILMHGGEAETSKNTFAGLNESDEMALIKFLESL
ncbi:di-heme oxidoredictase family protein [Reichenbachiella sp. MALMAid0571]|uniref:di-heme oxidoredictase family protein n=1 Tax=Reichenbachiella sp. MALMAid0571 TaxID=3143939 RepID=UPI0032E05357